MKPYRVSFFGTPGFVIPVIKALHEDRRFELVSIVTQAPKPVGRKQEITKSPVHVYAEDLNMKVHTPFKVRDDAFIHVLSQEDLDIAVVFAYGKILPVEVLQIPQYGVINIHPSLLPLYRGPSPIRFALMQGKEKTGVTFMLMNEKMDEGDILEQYEVSIFPNEKNEELEQRLSSFSAEKMGNVLCDFMESKIRSRVQDHTLATYTTYVNRETGLIDFTQYTAKEIYDLFRALSPDVGIYTILEGKRLKFLDISYEEGEAKENPGEIIQNSKIVTKKGYIIPHTIQLEGKNACSFSDFLRGYPKGSFID